MPELPEVELARQVLAVAVGREIRAVDDTDEWVCRPHRPGDLAGALVGARLVGAYRRGKTMWAETARDGEPGPRLGIHLGMAGWLVADDPGGGAPRAGGEPRRDDDPKRDWLRFALELTDGGHLWLYDKRRLSRVRLEPDIDALGPDAGEIGRDEFRARVGRGQAPVKARLLDQSVLAGVGNLLADETLWQARLSPSAPAGELSMATLDALRRTLRTALRSAIEHGGVHTGEIIPFRRAEAACPRCGAPMAHDTVGGRSTWWCSAEQV
jgi:formamidopyrimidine-DNA glycosylase